MSRTGEGTTREGEKETAGSCTLAVANAGTGYVVRVCGRGSLRESPGLRTLADRALDERPDTVVTIDLSSCDYLDSTFLGCLASLHKAFNAGTEPRLRIAGPDERLSGLFGPSGLDRILPRSAGDVPTTGDWVPVPAENPTPAALGRLLAESHRRLAEMGGPQAETYATIADQIERDLRLSRP